MEQPVRTVDIGKSNSQVWGSSSLLSARVPRTSCQERQEVVVLLEHSAVEFFVEAWWLHMAHKADIFKNSFF